jgi:hypothetical protein
MSVMELVYPHAAALRPARAVRAAAPRRPRAVEATDWVAVVFLLAIACLAAYTTVLRIEQRRWEEAALAAFTARVGQVPDVPLFDRAAREKVMADTAGCISILLGELLLIGMVPRIGDLAALRPRPLPPPGRVQRLIERWHGPRPRRGLTPAELRADAERCFRLAQGAVSADLARELEALGQALEREAHELDRRDRRAGSA